MRKSGMLDQLMLPLTAQNPSSGSDGMIRLLITNQSESLISESEPVDLVQSQHRPRSGRGAFFEITVKTEAMPGDVTGPGEQEGGKVFRVSGERNNMAVQHGRSHSANMQC